jgi:hypothetical protein
LPTGVVGAGDVGIRRILPGAAVEVRRIVAMRDESERLRAQVAGETRRATAVLRRAGLSTRDVGEILGISGARVAQIEREPRVPVRKTDHDRAATG